MKKNYFFCDHVFRCLKNRCVSLMTKYYCVRLKNCCVHLMNHCDRCLNCVKMICCLSCFCYAHLMNYLHGPNYYGWNHHAGFCDQNDFLIFH